MQGENKGIWGWFIKKLKIDLDLGIGDNFTIVFDKQKGIVFALGAELPNVEHRICARHIYGNRKKSFSSLSTKTCYGE